MNLIQLKIISNSKIREKPLKCPGILVKNHGPFVWGENSGEAVKSKFNRKYMQNSIQDT